MKKIGIALLLGSSLFAMTSNVQADEVYTFVVKKQEEKAKSRWSLQDWFDTRDRMKMMDLWLAIHSPSPFEFYLGGAHHWGGFTPGASFDDWAFSGAAYASIFGLGLEGESTNADMRWSALFLLRVFGFHYQATNITLQAGIRNSNGPAAPFRNAVAGVSMTIYLMKYFGLEGMYRHAFGSVTNAGLSGDRYEGGAFIDFQFLRIYGNYYSEHEYQDPTATQLFWSRSGVSLGSKLFF